LGFALPVMAEQVSKTENTNKKKYYTWVDAQGNMHNTLITPDKSEVPSVETKPTNVNIVIDGESFPTEEEYQQAQKEKSDNQKPFYTWTDAQGVVRSDIKPDVVIEFSASELVYDAVFAAPFRLPDYVKKGLCCEAYKDSFTTLVAFNGSSRYRVDDSIKAFKTQTGEVLAAYFSLDGDIEKEILTIKAYKIGEGSEFEIIALSKDFKPLFLESGVRGTFVEETWKDLAYKKVMLEVSDADIQHLIIFVKNEQGQSLKDYTMAVVRDTLISE
jgi:hypothetical protein